MPRALSDRSATVESERLFIITGRRSSKQQRAVSGLTHSRTDATAGPRRPAITTLTIQRTAAASDSSVPRSPGTHGLAG